MTKEAPKQKVKRLEDTLRSCHQGFDDIAALLSRVDAKHQGASPEVRSALNEICDIMQNGIMASYLQEIEEALGENV